MFFVAYWRFKNCEKQLGYKTKCRDNLLFPVCSRVPGSSIHNPQQENKLGGETRRNRSEMKSNVCFSSHFDFHFNINDYRFLSTCFPSDKVNNFKLTDKLPILKPKVLPATAKPTKQERKQTTTTASPTPGMRHQLSAG